MPYLLDPATGRSVFTEPSQRPHPAYFFHGFAPNNVDDSKFRDISGAGNSGSFGANLSVSNAWANAGYVSTVNPGSGTEDSVIRFPNLNFDFAGGEKLIVWWLGKCTKEGSDIGFLGDGAGTTYPGIRIRAKSTDKLDFAVYSSSASAFSGATANSVFDGNLHSFGIAIDGSAVKYALWVDEVLESAFSGNYGSFNGGTALDTRNSNTFQLGSTHPAVAASTDGLVTQTRALVILRLSSATTMPSVTTLTNVFAALRRNPGRRITASGLR